MENNRFNLIDEPWIPIAGHGLASLRDVFSNAAYSQLGGSPIEKIALMKLLLAIAQAASTPADEQAWKLLGAEQLAQKCLSYLEQWHDKFYLYGEQPFLQMPAIVKADLKPFGAVKPDIATGNTTVLLQSQVEKTPSDAEKSLLLVVLMGFALGGKKTDNSVTLTPGYVGKRNDKGKPSTSKPGPSVAHMGLLHNLVVGQSLIDTLWLNLFTQAHLQAMPHYEHGLGVAPWELMPAGEDDDIARTYKSSLMGRLVPLCRFCLLAENGLHYSEGLAHLNYKDGLADPTVAVDYSGKEPKALWANPDKRPWRDLTALLSFFSQRQSRGFDSEQLKLAISRVKGTVEIFGVWSGGLRVSSNAGEQYVSGTDDYVESLFWLCSADLGDFYLENLQQEMLRLESAASNLYGCVMAYYKEQKADGKAIAAKASNLYWQRCEKLFQALLDSLDESGQTVEKIDELYSRFAGIVTNCYDHYCPNESARQLDAWARCRPNSFKFFKREK